ncbi:hypothetical protein L1887_22594 [Cichorium endivia]|nr:hypothetical protein L1887_22594 [Cichorium endivia]
MRKTVYPTRFSGDSRRHWPAPARRRVKEGFVISDFSSNQHQFQIFGTIGQKSERLIEIEGHLEATKE